MLFWFLVSFQLQPHILARRLSETSGIHFGIICWLVDLTMRSQKTCVKDTSSEALMCSTGSPRGAFCHLCYLCSAPKLPGYISVKVHNQVSWWFSDCQPPAGPWGGPWSSLGHLHQMVWWLIFATQHFTSQLLRPKLSRFSVLSRYF